MEPALRQYRSSIALHADGSLAGAAIGSLHAWTLCSVQVDSFMMLYRVLCSSIMWL
jgi:hypothetical protein